MTQAELRDLDGNPRSHRPEQREIDHILADLRALRTTIIDAWRDSSVILVKEERALLRDEIRATCDMLTTLTSN